MNKVSLTYKIFAIAFFILVLIYCYLYLGIFDFPAWVIPPSEDPFNTPGISNINFFNGILYFFYYIFSLVGAYFTSLATLSPLDYMSIKFYGDNFFVSYYYTIYFVFILFSIVSLIFFAFKNNQKHAFYAFLGPILVVIAGAFHQFWIYLLSPAVAPFKSYLVIIFGLIALIFIIKGFTKAFKKHLRSLFYFLGGGYFVAVIIVPTATYSMLSDVLINLTNESPLDSGVYYFSNPLFIGSLLLFLFLEVAFQAIYIEKITEPTLTRGLKIKQQLAELEDKVKEYESRVKSDSEFHSMSISRQFSSEAFDFIRETAETGSLADKEESHKKIQTMREYLQLENYLETLYDRDPEAENSLKAETAKPSLKKITISSTVSILLKLVAIIFLTFLCFNPVLFFTAMGAPATILNSLEINMIEISVLIIAPLALLFPAIGLIIDIRRKKSSETLETVESPVKQYKLKE
jgi:hypothetical protein